MYNFLCKFYFGIKFIYLLLVLLIALKILFALIEILYFNK